MNHYKSIPNLLSFQIWWQLTGWHHIWRPQGQVNTGQILNDHSLWSFGRYSNGDESLFRRLVRRAGVGGHQRSDQYIYQSPRAR